MSAEDAWGVFPDAVWDGGIVVTGQGYVVRRMDDPRPPYCHMRPTRTYATERHADRAAAALTRHGAPDEPQTSPRGA